MTSPPIEKPNIGNGKSNKRKYMLESLSSKLFLFCALLSVLSLLLIVGFVFYRGSHPFIAEGYSFFDFIFGTDWVPSEDKFGIFPMIVASIYATIGALIIGVPIGLFTAIFLSEIAPKRVCKNYFTGRTVACWDPICSVWCFWTCNYRAIFAKQFRLSKRAKLIGRHFGISDHDASNNCYGS